MATSEQGDINTAAATTGQNNKLSTLNGNDDALEKATLGILFYDADGQTGTQILTESQSQNNFIRISGALTGALTLETLAAHEKGYWVKDISTGFTVTLQPTGGAGVVLPKNRWIFHYAEAGLFTQQISGWQDSSEAAALVFAAAYQVDATNPLKIRKNGALPTQAGGMVHLEGAVEETTTPPAAGDTIVTLPAGYRPANPLGFVVLAESASAANCDAVAIEIQTSGAVILRSVLAWTGAVNVPIDLSGISFFVGN